MTGGALPDGTGSRASTEPLSGVSAVPASIPSAMVRLLREKAKEFKYSAEKKRLDARELELRAGEQYDAFISFDLLADKLEGLLASGIAARSDETAQQAQPKARARPDAQPSSEVSHD